MFSSDIDTILYSFSELASVNPSLSVTVRAHTAPAEGAEGNASAEATVRVLVLAAVFVRVSSTILVFLWPLAAPSSVSASVKTKLNL